MKRSEHLPPDHPGKIMRDRGRITRAIRRAVAQAIETNRRLDGLTTGRTAPASRRRAG